MGTRAFCTAVIGGGCLVVTRRLRFRALVRLGTATESAISDATCICDERSQGDQHDNPHSRSECHEFNIPSPHHRVHIIRIISGPPVFKNRTTSKPAITRKMMFSTVV